MLQCSPNYLGLPEDRNNNIIAHGTKNPGSGERYFSLLELCSNRRKFFKTAQGTYDVGPDCMLEGDLIVGLMGASSLHALRPTATGCVFNLWHVLQGSARWLNGGATAHFDLSDQLVILSGKYSIKQEQ
ncbi:hypothetical protein BU25DRAFT_87830 [Macroventuria anomochaeta]|uniref:Uncharacterized protein n=1 Tax=Macroventuria anomochaeta TaxID=301207 RepID=A0ACB6SIC2_9PLEO|nr:uncharacterized protein BU25DRAFT_87830 [Macroventuria anomochaeta]KAF2633039.1 hypothetical protein BU25DRAFT_87830 [Macroventuria anomochaeta]